MKVASRGHSLCGDQRYGNVDKTQLALFAYKLGFFHPITKEKLEFTLLPPDKGYWTEFTM